MAATMVNLKESYPNYVDISPEQDGGLLKEIVQEGSSDEKPPLGSKVSVHYTGTLASDGSKFDSSWDRGERFQFKLGKGEVIKAWEIGVATMKKGEKCNLMCRSDFAYGESGSPPKIPPSATLKFEVMLFDWELEDLSTAQDGGILRQILTAGEGTLTPNSGALVEIHVKGMVDDNIFDERDVKFNLGEGEVVDIPEGVQKALESFKKNETSLIKLTPKNTFGSAGKPEMGVPPNTDVKYEITLKQFENAKEAWQMDQEEKIEQSKVYKEKGTNYFKEGKYRMAVLQYKKISDLLSYDSGLDDEKKSENHALKLASELNLAACYLKLNDYIRAREHADAALLRDPDNIKGLYRSAEANRNLGEIEAAIELYKYCITLEPTNTAAKRQLAWCKDKIKEYNQKEKSTYYGMFEKFNKQDINKATKASKAGFPKGGVGEWDDDKKESQDELSNVELLSSGDQINKEEMTSMKH